MRQMNLHVWRHSLLSCLAVCALVAIVAAGYSGKSVVRTGGVATVTASQDVTSLGSRISRLEQIVYSLESNINRLDQQSRLSSSRPASAGVRDPEVGLLRDEVESLQRRLVEIECGLVKIDERTLTGAARDGRRESTVKRVDPCRLDAQSPLRLSTHP